MKWKMELGQFSKMKQRKIKQKRRMEKKIIISFEIYIKGVLGVYRENKWASLVALRW